jgi:hypothetical protein
MKMPGSNGRIDGPLHHEDKLFFHGMRLNQF